MALLQKGWNVGKLLIFGVIVPIGKNIGKGVVTDVKNITKKDIIPTVKNVIIPGVEKATNNVLDFIQKKALDYKTAADAREQKVNEQVTEAPIPQNKEV